MEAVQSTYTRVVVLFTTEVVKETTELFEKSIEDMVGRNEVPNPNGTLFAICDLSKDISGKLKKFGGNPGVQILTLITRYELPLPADHSSMSNYFSVDFPAFFRKHSSLTAPIISVDDIRLKQPYNSGYTVLISSNNETIINKSHLIYHSIYDWLQAFDVNFAIVNDESLNTTIAIYLNGQIHSEYPKSAVTALFNFTAEPKTHSRTELTDFIST
jgi:hypothetical protein